MEIKPNSSHGPVPLSEVPTAHRTRRAGSDAGEFAGTEALQRALDQTPDIRPEAVARGQALAASDQFPPPDVLRRLAAVFVGEFTGPAAAGSRSPATDSTPRPSPEPS